QQSLEDTMIEVREDFMLSPAGDSQPTFRTAHFLNPIENSIKEPAFKCNPFSSSSSVFDPNQWPLEIHFNGWRYPQTKWVKWVDELKLKYESLWKKVGIFEAIMSTKCCIKKNQDLVYGVVEKWCCETNTFVFHFGEATITLEDIMVLGGYPVLGDPVFISLQDEEMREVEKKLIFARNELYKTKSGKPRPSIWMDIFIGKGSEIEHEAFLATWLGNPIALAPAVLASIYRDLTLFKKTIVDLSKYPTGGDRFPVEITLQSPFYLVQIWVWERFKNLQPKPQTMLTNHGDPLLFRWHKVKALKIDNVKLALDSASDDFLWRPYVTCADKCGMFYPNDKIWAPFEKDLDKEMLSFVTCLRVSKLVGFESMEQYLPHRVAMQFGMDQDVPSYVPRLNETKFIAWKNYCRPISDKKLYFPPRLFEADVTMRYAKWWKQLVLGHDDFVKKVVRRKRSASLRKHRLHVVKFNTSGNDVGVPPGFPPNLVDTLNCGKFCDDEGLKIKTRKVEDLYADVPAKNSVLNCLIDDEIIDADVEVCKSVLEEYKCGGKVHESKNLLNRCCSTSSEDDEKILPLKRPVSKDNTELSKGVLKDELKDANESKKSRMCSGRVCLSETQGEGKNKVSLCSHEFGEFISSNVSNEIAGNGDETGIKIPFCDRNGEKGESVSRFTLDMVIDLENRIQKLERVIAKLKEARFGHKVDMV
ncbi:serine/threonine-protein phosphatase, partial [Trifolium pratense]